MRKAVIVMMLLGAGVLAYSFEGESRSVYLPGPTTAGHYQIELSCDSCHTEPFSDEASLQAACLECHGEELEEAEDSHPEAKFTDPRNADRVAELDARLCVTCHREHRPEVTGAMGLSLPKDYCYRCHQSIGEERESHRGLGFSTCADAGCHNFHDNRALYEDYLEKHLTEPDVLSRGENPVRSAPEATERLGAEDMDAPPGHRGTSEIQTDWAASAHAVGGVSCTDCHGRGDDWSDAAASASCGQCHEGEKASHEMGRHGMAASVGLDLIRVEEARATMREEAHGRSPSCTACHGAHRFDTRRAAVEACLSCHADEHSTSYPDSPHAALWERDPTGRTGVSCATCHLPRIDSAAGVGVVHNQNATLRPNEKMVRPVCARCHGVGFALASLAEPRLIANNFDGRPDTTHESIRMITKRMQR